MDRRKFLTASAAVALAPLLPAIVEAAPAILSDDEIIARIIAATPRGGTAVIPSGVYRLTRSVVCPHFVFLSGDGKGTAELRYVGPPSRSVVFAHA